MQERTIFVAETIEHTGVQVILPCFPAGHIQSGQTIPAGRIKSGQTMGTVGKKLIVPNENDVIQYK